MPRQPNPGAGVILRVIGVPAPQGSKTRMPNGAIVDGSSTAGRARLAEWRRAVADTARTHLADHPGDRIDGPCRLTIDFRFAAAASNPYRVLHAVAPDVDKLARAVGDSLVHAGLLADDRLVAVLHVEKQWCQPGELPGAIVEIEDLTQVEAARRAARKHAEAARRVEKAARLRR